MIQRPKLEWKFDDAGGACLDEKNMDALQAFWVRLKANGY